MRWFIGAAFLLLVAGVGCILHAQSYPIYSDPDAPGRISEELSSLPRDTRFKEWYSRLRAVETPHKRLSDLGRGLCAAGVGLLSASAFWRLYHRWARMRGWGVILTVWCALWLIRIPLTLWYYGLRQQRFDYPVWGDSIGAPVFSESFAWLIAAVVTSIVLHLLLIRRTLPSVIHFARPSSPYGWFRAIVIGCWLAVLGICVFSGVPDGDEGVVLSSIMASVILLAILSAPELPRLDEPFSATAQPAGNDA